MRGWGIDESAWEEVKNEEDEGGDATPARTPIEPMDIDYKPVVRRGERYTQIVHEGYQLAALGRTSAVAFDKILKGMEEFIYEDA